MKLAVLGGGGVRTPFLAKSLAMGAKETGIDHIVFMDTDPVKLATYGKIARHIALLCAPGLTVELTGDAEYALTGAGAIITTIREEGDAGRVFDERTALEHGVLGQETTGAGGFAMALRSIPVLTEYCRMAQRLALPGAPIFNFTNPSGLVTQALHTQGFGTVYGICDAPSEFIKQLAALCPEGSEFTARCWGLNHLSWFDELRADGRDITQGLLHHPELYKATEMRLFEPGLLRVMGDKLPNEYLYFYYYPEKTRGAIMNAAKTRGETIQEINLTMDAALAKMDIDAEMDKAFACYMHHYNLRENSYFSIESGQLRPVQVSVPTVAEYVARPDSGSYAGVALGFLQALATGKERRMVLSIPNRGAIEGLRDEDVVEISCTITRQGAVPDRIGPIPEAQMALIRQVKLYENLTVQAILEKNRDKAVAALTVHPLIGSYPTAMALVDIYTKRYSWFIGQWKETQEG